MDTPIALPATLRRSHLSQTINHLLQRDPPVPFDFVLQGQLLRTSLKAYMEAHAVSPEEILTVEYILATPPPEPPTAQAMPDWVASLAARPGGLVAAGVYDGSVRLLQGPEPGAVLQGHSGAVRGLAWLHDGTEFQLAGADPVLVTASQDETLRVWQLPASGAPRCRFVMAGHAAGVASVAVQPTNLMVASACLDASIRLWSLNPEDDDLEEDDDEAPAAETPDKSRSKRRKLAGPPAKHKRSLAALHGSGAAIRTVLWPDRNTLITYVIKKKKKKKKKKEEEEQAEKESKCDISEDLTACRFIPDISSSSSSSTIISYFLVWHAERATTTACGCGM